MAAKDIWSWISVGAFTLLAFSLLWWANGQWSDLTAIAAAAREVPSARLLLWILTLVATGFGFGLAASAARAEQSPTRIPVLLVFSVLPFAILFFFWTQLALGWFSGLSLFQFVYNEQTIVASSLALGLFTATMSSRAIFGTDDEADQTETETLIDEPDEPGESADLEEPGPTPSD
jgi:hypothetical protein